MSILATVPTAGVVATNDSRSRIPPGIVIGIYVSSDADGRVWLLLPGERESAVAAASCLCDMSAVPAGSRLAVMFVEGRSELPVVVGPVLAEFGRGTDSAMPETVEIVASKQVVLRCGTAAVRVLSDGSAVIRGDQVISRARKTNRIRGGNVQIN